jgi:conjugative relaxase-like TrwC/TraI family protein
MLSVSQGKSAGDAEHYFKKEDYYLKGQESTEWLGKGAEALGLQGQVIAEDFKAIAEGRHPQTDEQLIAPKVEQGKDKDGNKIFNEDGTPQMIEKHRAGNDMTFSAPKSVSVAFAAGVGDVKEAHDQAVRSVMEHVQEHYSQHRSPDGIQIADNLIAAKFDHVTSRALDPQLHSHCFLLNAVQDKDGAWKANEPKNIFVDQKQIGMLYRQELANQLQERGFQIDISDRQQLFFEIKGVDEKLIDQFSKRREAIENQVKEWKVAGTYKGVSEPRLYEMAALGTRDAKDPNITKEQVREKWDDGFQSAGTTSEQVKEKVESVRQQTLEARQQEQAVQQQQPGQPQPEKITAAEVVKAAAEHLNDKEAVFDRAAVMKAAAQLSGGQHNLKELNQAIESQADTGVVRMGAEKGREFYSTEQMKALELRNVETVKGLAGTFQSNTSKPEVEAYLAGRARTEEKNLSPEQAKFKEAYLAGIQNAERTAAELQAAGKTGDGSVKMTAGQQAHVTNELAGSNGVAVTQGDPGTGKTFASKMVEDFNRDVLQGSGREHYTINVAYTGKAAMEMSEASGKPAYTIDSFLNAYQAGKIQVAGSEHQSQRGRQLEQGEGNRAERAAQAGNEHADAMSYKLAEAKGNDKYISPQWSSSEERNGVHGAYVGGGTTIGARGGITWQESNGGMKTQMIALADGTKGHTAPLCQDSCRFPSEFLC